MRTARLARPYVEQDEALSSDMKGERVWTQGEGVFYFGQVVRITVFCSAIVIDVIVHCHTAGAF